MHGQDSVASILEADARGETAEIFADIRRVLGTGVVNLIWRHLATMPGTLPWTWATVRPLYLGAAPLHAEAVRRTIALPELPGFSTDTLLAAGIDDSDQAIIRDVLDSYQHTNALALVVLSALLAHYEPRPADPVIVTDAAPSPGGVKIPELPPMDALDPEVARLVGELNGFGEDTEPQLAGAAADGRPARCTDARDAFARTCAWPDAGAAIEASRAARRVAGSAEIVPAVRRASDRPHDRAVRADPPRHAGLSPSGRWNISVRPGEMRRGLMGQSSLRAKRSNPFFLFLRHDGLLRFARNDGGNSFAFSRRIAPEACR